MRARNIKPGFFKNDNLAELDPLARLLFIGLWCMADREGRLEDRPKRIKAEILPYDSSSVEKLLEQLHTMKFIVRYEDKEDGSRYISIPNFSKHQNPHKNEKASEIPDVTKCREITGAAPEKHSTNRADSLIPDSGFLIPEERPCVFSIHAEDLIADFPFVELAEVEKEITSWKKDHDRWDDIDPRKIVLNILQKQQEGKEKMQAKRDLFEYIWKEYPKKDGDKKKIWEKFNREIATEQDMADVRCCIDNYFRHVHQERDNGFLDLKYKNRATWFNNWREWLEWEPSKERSANGSGNQGSAAKTGGEKKGKGDFGHVPTDPGHWGESIIPDY